jgi:hypothetical protein
MADKENTPGVCKHGDCLHDAGPSGYCRTHRENTSCANCGSEQYEHFAIALRGTKDKAHVYICPTAIYKEIL